MDSLWLSITVQRHVRLLGGSGLAIRMNVRMNCFLASYGRLVACLRFSVPLSSPMTAVIGSCNAELHMQLRKFLGFFGDLLILSVTKVNWL